MRKAAGCKEEEDERGEESSELSDALMKKPAARKNQLAKTKAGEGDVREAVLGEDEVKEEAGEEQQSNHQPSKEPRTQESERRLISQRANQKQRKQNRTVWCMYTHCRIIYIYIIYI